MRQLQSLTVPVLQANTLTFVGEIEIAEPNTLTVSVQNPSSSYLYFGSSKGEATPQNSIAVCAPGSTTVFSWVESGKQRIAINALSPIQDTNQYSVQIITTPEVLPTGTWKIPVIPNVNSNIPINPDIVYVQNPPNTSPLDNPLYVEIELSNPFGGPPDTISSSSPFPVQSSSGITNYTQIPNSPNQLIGPISLTANSSLSTKIVNYTGATNDGINIIVNLNSSTTTNLIIYLTENSDNGATTPGSISGGQVLYIDYLLGVMSYNKNYDNIPIFVNASNINQRLYYINFLSTSTPEITSIINVGLLIKTPG